jgi:hypothetical protein
MRISSDDVHADLARSIATKNGTVLHEDNARPIACGRNRRNRAGHSASDYNKIHREVIGF